MKQAVPGARSAQPSRRVYGGVAAKVPANQIAHAAKRRRRRRRSAGHPRAAADRRDAALHRRDQRLAARSAARDRAGNGVIVGVIDTRHLAGASVVRRPRPPAAARRPVRLPVRRRQRRRPPRPDVRVQQQAVGAYAFTDTYLAVIGARRRTSSATTRRMMCSARDADGHGTHTASTAAGDRVDSRQLFGVERGPISGIAPGARVIIYRVCLAQGCFGSDSVAAVQQAILDGVDVINFSIGGGANPYTDPVELAFLDAFNAGDLGRTPRPATAAPAQATADHGGPWVTTVGASTGAAAFTSTLHLTRRRRRDARPPRRRRSRPGSRRRRRSCSRRPLPGEDVALPDELAAGRGHRQDRRVPARHERPRRQGLQRRCRAARPG